MQFKTIHVFLKIARIVNNKILFFMCPIAMYEDVAKNIKTYTVLYWEDNDEDKEMS